MSALHAPDDLRPALDALAERGAHILRGRHTRHVLREGLPLALFCTVASPLLVLAVQGVQRLAGVAPWQPGVGGIVAGSALVFLIVIALLASWAARRPVSRRAALALFDGAAQAGERLVTADELLDVGPAGGFPAAAIEDARWFLRPALEACPPVVAAPAATSSIPRGALWALAALVLAWTLGRHGGVPVGPPAGTAPSPGAKEVATAPPRGRDTEVPAGHTKPPAVTEEDAGPDTPLQIEPRETKTASHPGELPEEARRKEGKGGAGRSSEAQASRGESDARGTPTNQGPESKKPPVRKPLKPDTKKRKARRKADPRQEPKKSTGEESGSTAGRGSSKGSNRNPVTSDWTSKDQVTTEDDEEIEDDEDVEDDTEDSEARGGMQPTLRDRKPPVSRDLTIGFGNQPSPDANGRGGPSQPKKSRGTASLVLGVPIPDRVKGQPNPGKTKITQERVEPRREQAPPGTAQARTPRQGPTGPLAAPRFPPWLRELLRRHFLRSERQPK